MLGLAIEAGGYLELELTLDVELLESNLGVDLVAKNRLVNIGNTDCKQILLQCKNGALELFDRIGANRLEDIVHGPIAHKTRRLLRLGIQNDGSSLLAHKAATDAGLLEALAVDPIGVAIVGTDKHRHVRTHCIQQLLGLNLALVLEHGVVPTHALIELAAGMLFHIFADGIHVLVHGLETQNVNLVGKLASTRREMHMSIAEARHEHTVARLDHLSVRTDVLVHPRLVAHIDENAVLNRYRLSGKLCAIRREHLPLKHGIRLHRKLLSCDPLLSSKRISQGRLRSERRFIPCAKRSISLNLSCTSRLFWQVKSSISFFGAITPRPVRARRTTAHGSHRIRFSALIPLGFTLRLSIVDSRIGPHGAPRRRPVPKRQARACRHEAVYAL